MAIAENQLWMFLEGTDGPTIVTRSLRNLAGHIGLVCGVHVPFGKANQLDSGGACSWSWSLNLM